MKNPNQKLYDESKKKAEKPKKNSRKKKND